MIINIIKEHTIINRFSDKGQERSLIIDSGTNDTYIPHILVYYPRFV